ncbi:MAG: response regulator [Terriglobales bacterium]|jgi:DNA-binding NtrC family response regulator
MPTNIDVMVLDDEPTVCERLKDFFEKDGMKVETFTESSKAVERLAQQRFHVVVTDLKMKGPTGIDVLVAVKNQNLPTEVIVITGYRTMDVTRAAECVGAYAFLDKPFRLEQLRDLVKKAAKKAGSRSEA